MESPFARRSRVLRVAIPIAFTVGLVFMGVQLLVDDLAAVLSVYGMTVGPIALASVGLIAIGLAGRAWSTTDAEVRRRRFDEALLVPCALVPVAVVAPWTIAPSHFGPSFASLPFFVAWLTRYPTVLGVNHEVLLGLLAMLGACAMPSFFACSYYSRSDDDSAGGRAPRTRWVALFVAMQLVPYAPVLVRLDSDLILFGWLVANDEANTLLGGSGAPWWQNAWLGAEVAAGALLRLAATASMIALLARVAREEPRPAQSEIGSRRAGPSRRSRP